MLDHIGRQDRLGHTTNQTSLLHPCAIRWLNQCDAVSVEVCSIGSLAEARRTSKRRSLEVNCGLGDPVQAERCVYRPVS